MCNKLCDWFELFRCGQSHSSTFEIGRDSHKKRNKERVDKFWLLVSWAFPCWAKEHTHSTQSGWESKRKYSLHVWLAGGGRSAELFSSRSVFRSTAVQGCTSVLRGRRSRWSSCTYNHWIQIPIRSSERRSPVRRGDFGIGAANQVRPLSLDKLAPQLG